MIENVRLSVEDEAKAAAYHALQNERLTSLPFMRSYLNETMALFGDDPWPYGIERNRKTLESFLQFAFEQGVCRRLLSVDTLFPDEVQVSFRI